MKHEKNFFGLTDKELLGSNIVLIEGIAGSAKSTNIHRILTENGIDYLKVTSTNKLKEDSVTRFGCDCQTIHSGLFVNTPDLCAKEKDPEQKYIVIDEILQGPREVWSWIYHHCMNYHIFILTDENQMLNPQSESFMMRKLNELKSLLKEPGKKKSDKPLIDISGYGIGIGDLGFRVELKETFRARDERTKAAFDELYRNVNNDSSNMFNIYMLNGMLSTAIYDDLEFDRNDTFLTHSNNIEEELYRDFDLYNRDDVDWIKKGFVSGKELSHEALMKLPIMPQIVAESSTERNYRQAINVGSVTRYQGSEVKDGHKCYFIVGKDDFVGNREFYTALTRCKTIDQFVVVVVDRVKPKRISELGGVPVVYQEFFHVPLDFEVDGVTLASLVEKNEVSKKGVLGINIKEYKKFYDKIYDMYSEPGKCYHKKEFRSNWIRFVPTKDETSELDKNKNGNKASVTSQVMREGFWNFDFMDDVYRLFYEKTGSYNLWPAPVSEGERTGRYSIDLMSAYHHVIFNEYMPVRGRLYTSEKLDKMNFYLVQEIGNAYSKSNPGFVATDDLAHYMESEYGCRITFLFGTDRQKGSRAGSYFVGEAHKTVESKAAISGINFGFLRRTWLCPDKDKEGNDLLVRDEANCHELVFVALASQIWLKLIKLKKAIQMSGYKVLGINTDEVIFDQYGIDGLSDNPKGEMDLCVKYAGLDNYYYRLREETYPCCPKPDKIEICSNFTLQTKEERRREQNRNNQRARRARLKAEKLEAKKAQKEA